MAAVAHASPADLRRLALVRTGPVVRPARTTLPVTVYRRRRALTLLAVISVVAALVLGLQGLLAVSGEKPLTASQRSGVEPGRVYVVQPGDTFWAIAERLHPGEDPRPLVSRMVAAHGRAVLVAGERLPLPAAA
jgi:hypothetical protein